MPTWLPVCAAGRQFAGCTAGFGLPAHKPMSRAFVEASSASCSSSELGSAGDVAVLLSDLPGRLLQQPHVTSYHQFAPALPHPTPSASSPASMSWATLMSLMFCFNKTCPEHCLVTIARGLPAKRGLTGKDVAQNLPLKFRACWTSLIQQCMRFSSPQSNAFETGTRTKRSRFVPRMLGAPAGPRGLLKSGSPGCSS